MSSLITVATCNLNQWAMDFSGNERRIIKSCELAKAQRASYRLGPELEIPGYGCEDHFLESDTIIHSWEVLASLINSGCTDSLLCDFGMPVLHKSSRFNCRVFVYNRRVLLIRPKMELANDGNYREGRWFAQFNLSSSSDSARRVEDFPLPRCFLDKLDDLLCPPPSTVPFGFAILRSLDGVTFGAESCEELWSPSPPHVRLSLNGCDVIGNGSGSHHELRKLDARLALVKSATTKCGGCYLYANQRGCDGSRLYFDGCAMVSCNGDLLSQASQFSLSEVEVVTATIDVDEIRSYRAGKCSFTNQATRLYEKEDIAVFTIDANLLHPYLLRPPPSPPIAHKLHTPEEECALGPACWLWDYLRRSGAAGFFLPLSGGADSAAVATIVAVMSEMAVAAAKSDPTGVVADDVRRLCPLDHREAEGGANKNKQKADSAAAAAAAAAAASDEVGEQYAKDQLWVPSSGKELAAHIFSTCYMPTSNSGTATNRRAVDLAACVGSYHTTANIDVIVAAVLAVLRVATGRVPNYLSAGGTGVEDVALQNVQARSRMVLAYLMAQLLPWCRGRTGFLLVLASGNVDECLRGYLTKYDCSSADLNPIGSISKGDLKKMLLWASVKYDIKVLADIVAAPPTAELRPQVQQQGQEGEHSQTDEEDMGMTYDELGVFGRLRKQSRAGPVSMYNALVNRWGSTLSPRQVAEKVKRFFFYYSVNRHKMCTMTPAYHAEGYSPDDNRFDLRQILYNSKWTHQFQQIDKLVASEGEHRQGGK